MVLRTLKGLEPRDTLGALSDYHQLLNCSVPKKLEVMRFQLQLWGKKSLIQYFFQFHFSQMPLAHGQVSPEALYESFGFLQF